MGNRIDIYFKYKANKEISKLSKKEAIVIEAIQTISQEKMNDQIRKKLFNTLNEDEMKHLLEQGEIHSLLDIRRFEKYTRWA